MLSRIPEHDKNLEETSSEEVPASKVQVAIHSFRRTLEQSAHTLKSRVSERIKPLVNAQEDTPWFRTAFQILKSGLVDSYHFIKSCLVDGSKALLAGHYDKRQASLIIAANVPAIIGAMVITVPGILFHSPGHQAYYHFANNLGCEPASLIPMFLGATSSLLGLRIPLG